MTTIYTAKDLLPNKDREMAIDDIHARLMRGEIEIHDSRTITLRDIVGDATQEVMGEDALVEMIQSPNLTKIGIDKFTEVVSKLAYDAVAEFYDDNIE